MGDGFSSSSAFPREMGKKRETEGEWTDGFALKAGRVRKGGERKPNCEKSISSTFFISDPFGGICDLAGVK